MTHHYDDRDTKDIRIENLESQVRQLEAQIKKYKVEHGLEYTIELCFTLKNVKLSADEVAELAEEFGETVIVAYDNEELSYDVLIVEENI